MTTPKAKFAGLALIAVLCAGFILGLAVLPLVMSLPL